MLGADVLMEVTNSIFDPIDGFFYTAGPKEGQMCRGAVRKLERVTVESY